MGGKLVQREKATPYTPWPRGSVAAEMQKAETKSENESFFMGSPSSF